MTAVYVVQRAYDDPEFYDTERRCGRRRFRCVEPAPRGGDYWNRTSRGAAA